MPSPVNDAVRKGDLTEGNVVRKLLLFSLPIVAGNLFMQLYNVVDSLVVGNFVGSDAIAAVGASFPIMMLFNALYMGISAGASVVIAQCFGAKNKEALSIAGSTAFTLALLMGIVVTVIGLLFSKPLLLFLGTPENIIADSTAYLAIVFAGTVGNILYNLCSGVLRGLGDSRWPMLLLILSSIINIVLDLVFVINFNMGVAGVAWATTIAHFVSGICAWIRINKADYGLVFSLRKLQIDGVSAKLIVKLGLPAGLQMMANSLGSMVIQSFANSFGSDFIAANSLIMKVDGFAMTIMMGMGMALTTFVGQNVGAGRIDRVKKGVRATGTIIMAVGLSLGVLFFFFGILLMRAFTDAPEVLRLGEIGIRIIAFFYCFMGLGEALSGALRGAGSSMAPMLFSLASMVVRIPAAYFLAVQPGNAEGLFVSMVISILVRTGLVMLYYKKGKWKDKALLKAASTQSSGEIEKEIPAVSEC